MKNYEALADRLRSRIFEVLSAEGVEAMPGDDDSLVDSGLLDSLAVVGIAVFMEAEFGLDFSIVYFDVTNFESISTMARFVESSLKDR